MEIIIIAAIDENNGIGYNNKLLKHIPEDLKRFKELTLFCPVIMGRKTWESLLIKPLPSRINCVISNNIVEGYPDVVSKSLDDAIDYFRTEGSFSKVYIIGGERVYKDAIKLADRLEITHIKGSYEADTFFPEIDKRFEIINDEIFDNYKFSTYICANHKK